MKNSTKAKRIVRPTALVTLFASLYALSKVYDPSGHPQWLNCLVAISFIVVYIVVFGFIMTRVLRAMGFTDEEIRADQ